MLRPISTMPIPDTTTNRVNVPMQIEIELFDDVCVVTVSRFMAQLFVFESEEKWKTLSETNKRANQPNTNNIHLKM